MCGTVTLLVFLSVLFKMLAVAMDMQRERALLLYKPMGRDGYELDSLQQHYDTFDYTGDYGGYEKEGP